MSDLILYVSLTVIGYIAGDQLRKREKTIPWASAAQTLAILFMVFLMGVRMGSNAKVIRNLNTIGLYAFLMTVVTMVLSVIAVHFARKLLRLSRYGLPEDTTTGDADPDRASIEDQEDDDTSEEKKSTGFDPMTFLILGFVVAGLLAGYLFVYRKAFGVTLFEFETVDAFAATAIQISLSALLFFIGLDLGQEGTVAGQFRKVGIRILLIPAAVIVGTFAGALLLYPLMPFHSPKESLAIGAGFGWYTLAPGIIMNRGYMIAGSISFMHNVMRELFAIVLIPVVAKKIGYVEAIGLPASPAMDVCLPVTARATNGMVAVLSFVSGATLSMLVPVLVPLILSF